LVVSGTAAASARVRIYLSDALVGDALADANGNFALLAIFPVKPGSHTVRADVIDPANGSVMARASVPFEREAGDAVAVAAAPVTAAPAAAADNSAPAAAAAPAAENAAVAEPQQTLIPAPDFALSTAAPGVKTQTSVVIRKGDTLWQISRRVYGKGVQFSTIYNANTSQISDPNRIFPEQVFVMPALTEDGTPADFGGITDQKKVDVQLQ
jgi:nucleoid-associated protein YgaU